MFSLLARLLEKLLMLLPQNRIYTSILNFLINLFIKNSDIYPHNKAIMFILGRLFFLKNDYDKSIEWLEKILVLYPRDKETMLHLATLYILKNEYEKSLMYYFKILDDYPIRMMVKLFKNSLFSEINVQLTSESDDYEKAGKFREAQALLFILEAFQERFTTQQVINTGDIQDRLEKLANKIQHQEAELIRSRQMAALGVMASGLAHEINQPLQIILARAQNCISDIKCNTIDKNGIINDFEQISNTVRRIDKIVNHLHVLSRDRKLEFKKININDVIHNSFIMFQQQLKNRGIAVELKLSDNLPPVMADMVQLEQIFINLINNSRDTLEEGSEDKKITITTQALNGQIEVIFHDNGKGIASEDLSKIFNAFYTTKQKGVGLGLYISHDIIRNYGGTIIAESNINEGTTFILHLPIAGKESDI